MNKKTISNLIFFVSGMPVINQDVWLLTYNLSMTLAYLETEEKIIGQVHSAEFHYASARSLFRRCYFSQNWQEAIKLKKWNNAKNCNCDACRDGDGH